MRHSAPVVGLLLVIEHFLPVFSRRSFEKSRQLWLSWLLVEGPRRVSSALVAGGLAGQRHHGAWYRLFSSARWSADDLGRRLVLLVLETFVAADAPVVVALDDTLAHHKGPKVWGIGNHLDAVRSTRGVRVFAFGHLWVVASIVVRPAFSHRPWAIPVVFRLYRTQKVSQKQGVPHRTKTSLARELVELLAAWLPDRRLCLVADRQYACRPVARDLPDNVEFVGAMHPDAALTSPPVVAQSGRGRRRIRGERLPTPAQLAADPDLPWQTAEVTLYGRRQTLRYKTLDAQWYRVCHAALVRVVVVDVPTGGIGVRVYFSTDLTLQPADILQRYALRWTIEVAFRDLKQTVGLSNSNCRSRRAVQRTVPWVATLYGITIVWYERFGHRSALDAVLCRPWYRHRKGPSYADIARAARLAAAWSGLVDPLGWKRLDNKSNDVRSASAQMSIRTAA